mmetsp:Transcript_22805/g.58457  ORF Transcript_22805/g.58457 Transcript_22805/m.58457 type:complete len:107 (+) Transcript_22805:1108-1428(+)
MSFAAVEKDLAADVLRAYLGAHDQKVPWINSAVEAPPDYLQFRASGHLADNDTMFDVQRSVLVPLFLAIQPAVRLSGNHCEFRKPEMHRSRWMHNEHIKYSTKPRQ